MQLQINIKGTNINYEVEGDGNPVILLHGWLASLETMKPLQKSLSKNFKVYNIDIVGFGKSDLPKKPMSTDDFGNFIRDFIKELKIQNPIIIGHSNGGRAAINYAGRNLGQIKKLILIDSTGPKLKRSLKYYIKIYTFKFLKKVVNVFSKNSDKLKEKLLKKFASNDYKDSPEVLRKTMNIIINESQESIMKNINVPTLLIWGEKDTETSVQSAKKIEKLIPDCGLVVFENAGHYSYLDCLPRCIIILNEFLKKDIKK